MRNLFVFMMVSVDGYFEGLNHDLSWHHVDAEFHTFAGEQNSRIGAILFGRRTYDMMASFWPTPQGMAVDPATARFMNETPKAVVSRAALKPAWSNTTAIGANVNDEIEKLKAQAGNDIAIFGSNNLCVNLMTAGLVDEFRIMVSPVVLGNGTPLFTGLAKRTKLKLCRTREFKSGNVLSYYVPIG